MPEENRETWSVSRETHEKLQQFEHLVQKWTQRINLVSRQDLDHLWTRHIRDSAQLADLSESPQRWLDLGSGGGFPGMVVAIVMLEKGAPHRITLVESDSRKCAFLKTAARTLSLSVSIEPRRIEDLEPMHATTISARALAPLSQLLAYAHVHLVEEGTALFPKGKDWQKELDDAKEKWSFDGDVIQSVTDADAAVLKIRNIKRKQVHGR